MRTRGHGLRQHIMNSVVLGTVEAHPYLSLSDSGMTFWRREKGGFLSDFHSCPSVSASNHNMRWYHLCSTQLANPGINPQMWLIFFCITCVCLLAPVNWTHSNTHDWVCDYSWKLSAACPAQIVWTPCSVGPSKDSLYDVPEIRDGISCHCMYYEWDSIWCVAPGIPGNRDTDDIHLRKTKPESY